MNNTIIHVWAVLMRISMVLGALAGGALMIWLEVLERKTDQRDGIVRDPGYRLGRFWLWPLIGMSLGAGGVGVIFGIIASILALLGVSPR